MPSLALACRLSAASAAIQSLFKRAQSIAKRYGEPLLAVSDNLSNAWQDSTGTLPATVGSPIGRLGDLTGLGNNATQSTAGNRPAVALRNGKPVLSFNGATNSMQLATNPIGPNLSQPYTIIVAGVCGSAVSGARRFAYGDQSRRFGLVESGEFAIVNQGNAGAIAFPGAMTVGEAFVMEVMWDGTNATLVKNGIKANPVVCGAPTTATGAAFIGQAGWGGQFFNGQITAVTAFDRVLSDSERTTIGKAFARELGVTYG